MKLFIAAGMLLIALAGRASAQFIVVPTTSPSTRPSTAKADAEAVLASGKLQLCTYGLLFSEPGDTYRRLLKERLGVETEWIAGCEVTTAIMDYAREYNAVMVIAIHKKFGDDAMDKLWKEAEDNFYGRRSISSTQPAETK